MILHVAVLDIVLIVNILMFTLGIALVVGFKKVPSLLRTKPIQILLGIIKVFTGATILTMLIFKVDFYSILGSGLDMLLSFVAGVLLASGLLLKETDIL